MIREHANIMADALQSKLLRQDCLCQLTHNASLVLEVRRERRRAKDNSFHVLFGFDAGAHPPPWSSREMEIQACEIPPILPEEHFHETTPKIIVEVIPTTPETPAVFIRRDQSPSSKPSPKTKDKKRFKSFFRSLSNSSNVSVPLPSTEANNTVAAPETPQVLLTTKQVRNVVFEIPQPSTPQDKAQEIENLCAAISAAKDLPSWTGVLSSERNIIQEIRTASESIIALDPNAHIVSLADLLSSGLWKSKPRSKLGLKLASMVLQLYKTPWLRDDWGKEDVLFVQQGDGEVLIDRPFLKPRFTLPLLQEEQIRAAAGTLNMHVPTLFALGVVLIELHLGKPIEALIEDGLDANLAEVCALS